MKCPVCSLEYFKCIDTRQRDNGRQRVLKCYNCDARFKTMETITEVKFENEYHFRPIVEPAVDPKEMINSLRKPMAELRRILRTYEEKLG